MEEDEAIPVRRVLDRSADAIDKACRLAQIPLSPNGVRSLLSTRPFSVSAFRLVSGIRQLGLSFRTIIDVGANVGQFTAAALTAWPDSIAIAFEPLPAQARRLQSLAAKGLNILVHPTAVGESNGTVTFYPHPYSHSSSLLRTAPHARRRTWGREDPPMELPMVRLDSAIQATSLHRPCLLKIDVQGSETRVLEGAGSILGAVDAILIEAAFIRSYIEQPLFGDLHALLTHLGWTTVEALDCRREGRLIVEADLLYRRG